MSVITQVGMAGFAIGVTGFISAVLFNQFWRDYRGSDGYMHPAPLPWERRI